MVNYISKIDGFSDSIIYEDGSVIDSNGGVGPAGTLTKVGTHQWTFNGTQFRISMDGKRVYAINGFLVFEIAEILETPTISISEKTLTITEVPNATSYNVYANNVFKANITDLTLDLKTLNLAQGTYTITAKAKADGYSDSERSTSLSYIVEQTDISNYLVDRVEIGDWVDLGEGLAYTNQETYYSEYTNTDYSSTNGPTGWRVLSKTGSGETGTVTLVSAGTPLSYYYICGESETSILSLSNLSETITLTTSGTGFSANG